MEPQIGDGSFQFNADAGAAAAAAAAAGGVVVPEGGFQPDPNAPPGGAPGGFQF